MRQVVGYTIARLGLFVASVILLGALGVDGLMMWAGGILLSGVVSFFLLSSMRSAFGAQVESALAGINKRIDDAARKEDLD